MRGVSMVSSEDMNTQCDSWTLLGVRWHGATCGNREVGEENKKLRLVLSSLQVHGILSWTFFELLGWVGDLRWQLVLAIWRRWHLWEDLGDTDSQALPPGRWPTFNKQCSALSKVLFNCTAAYCKGHGGAKVSDYQGAVDWPTLQLLDNENQPQISSMPALP